MVNSSYSTPKDTWKLQHITLSYSNYKLFLNFIVDFQFITILFYNIFISLHIVSPLYFLS